MGVELKTAVEAQEILDALPMFAMILDAHHNIVMSNSWFAENSGDDAGECPVACYQRVHRTDGPHPDCPLTEAVSTRRTVKRDLRDDLLGVLTITVSPLNARFGADRLFLHLTEVK